MNFNLLSDLNSLRYFLKLATMFAVPLLLMMLIITIRGEDDCPRGSNPWGSDIVSFHEC